MRQLLAGCYVWSNGVTCEAPVLYLKQRCYVWSTGVIFEATVLRVKNRCYIWSNGVTCEAPVLGRAANKQEETDDPLKWHCVNLPSLLVPSSKKNEENNKLQKTRKTPLLWQINPLPTTYITSYIRQNIFWCPFAYYAQTTRLGMKYCGMDTSSSTLKIFFLAVFSILILKLNISGEFYL